MKMRKKEMWDRRVYPCADCPYRERDVSFCGFCLQKIIAELKKENPAMLFKMIPALEAENGLFFRLGEEVRERYGAVGYLRADFGKTGGEFWTTWFDSEKSLKTPVFKKELDRLINFLRDGGPEPPFASRDNLEAFCAAKPGLSLPARGDGYRIRTDDYSYYIRCLPTHSDYDIGLYAYDNRFLLPELAGQHELPDTCYSTLPSTGELIMIARHEKGYTRCDALKPDPAINREFADTSNSIFGVTKAQEAAMLAGSMIGWDTPAAKPWSYDQDGQPWPKNPVRNAPER